MRALHQCARLQEEVELAVCYLEKWKDGSQGAEVSPSPLEIIQETIFHPGRFPVGVLRSGLGLLMQKYRGTSHTLGPLESVEQMRERARTVIDEIVEKSCVAAVDLWSALLAHCEHHWRVDCDSLLGVVGMDLGVSGCLLVKQQGISVLRLAKSSEHDFHKLMLEMERKTADSAVSVSEDSCLMLAYRSLYWMQSEDPGGIVFSQRMMKQEAELVVSTMLRELQGSTSEPPDELDPEDIRCNHPQLWQCEDWSSADSDLCRSLHEHLSALAKFAGPDQGFAEHERTRETWKQRYQHDVCEQLVNTHYEVVRGLALALALIDYQHKVAGGEECGDDEYDRVQDRLRDTVLPLLSKYHILRWSARRPLHTAMTMPQGRHGAEAQQPAHAHAHKTLLSLSVADDASAEATSICDPIHNEFDMQQTNQGLIWKTFRALRRLETHVSASAMASQWRDLLDLCEHPANVRAPVQSSSWCYRKVVVTFVRGYACLHLLQWKEANRHLATFVRESRRIITTCDIEARRTLVDLHPLTILHEELAGKGDADLQDAMKRLALPEMSNLLDYFLLLHDCRRREGLIHSVRRVIEQRIRFASEGPGGSNRARSEGAMESFSELMRLALESLQNLDAHLQKIEDRSRFSFDDDAEGQFAVDCFRHLIAGAQHHIRTSWLLAYTDCELYDAAYDLIADTIALCQDDGTSKMRQYIDSHQGEVHTDVINWVDKYSRMCNEDYANSALRQDIFDKKDHYGRTGAYECLLEFVDRAGKRRPDKLCRCYR